MRLRELLAKISFYKDKIMVISIYFITLSESWFMINRNLNSFFEYIGYGFLLLSISINCWEGKKCKSFVKNITVFILVCFLMSFGFLIQDLAIKRKIVLLFTVVAIVMVSVLAEKYLDSLVLVRQGAYAILAAIVTACILGFLGGDKIIENVVEGVFGIEFGLCGGMRYKNYFAADMLTVFIGIYFYHKYIEQKKIDKIMLWITGILIILSNSKGGWILFITFLITSNFSVIRKIRKEHRKLIFIIAGIAAIIMCYSVVSSSGTYLFRIRGLTNYIQYYAKDTYHLVFGNAESVYDKTENYVLTIRAIVGWDGSLEIALLNILIKSGILGIIGYGIIYIRFFKKAFCNENWMYKEIVFSIATTMLVSSWVEAYIQSVHCIYAIFSYMIISGLYSNKSIGSTVQDGKEES